MGADILSLQSRGSARVGGSTYLASAATIYNELAATDPKALTTLLANDWPLQLYVTPSPPPFP